MKFSLSVLALASATLVAAAPQEGAVARGDSGCYPYESPGCCINHPVCQCKDGKFYKYNGAAGCQPPGAILGSRVPGSCC